MSTNQRIDCECGYDLITPWDRYCAVCGRSLTNDGQLIFVPPAQKVDGRDTVRFFIKNNSRVTVHVRIPNIAADHERLPPRWLAYDPATGGAQEFAVPPNDKHLVEFGINRAVIDEMLRQPDIRDRTVGEGAVVYGLRVFVDGDYRDQAKTVNLSLIGQADLRPEAIEFPAVWLKTGAANEQRPERRLTLPLVLFNASGEEMFVDHVQTHCFEEDPRVQEIVAELFPDALFAPFANKAIAGGAQVELNLESLPIEQTLERMTARRPQFDDPHATRRSKNWFEKWPSLTRLRFVVETTLRTSTEKVPQVRSLVVLTLIRPPLIRDQTPDDQLWKRVDGPNGRDLLHRVEDDEKCELVADLNNDSCVPVTVKRVYIKDRPWLTLLDHSAVEGRILQPGGEFTLRARVDLSKRRPAELRESTLSAEVMIETEPPTPLPALDPINIEAPSTVTLPGCLGIDFGTSNCAVCFMPDGDPPSYGDVDPVPLPLEKLLDDRLDIMPSALWRCLEDQPSQSDREFVFGSRVALAEGARPGNTIRGIKRILAYNPSSEFRLYVESATNPIAVYTAEQLAARMLNHIIRQLRLLSSSAPRLKARVLASSSEDGNTAFPSRDEIQNARAFRFSKAIFTHPVEASDDLKRALYRCAMDAGLAYENVAGERKIISYEAFVRERLIDESTAAISHFIYRNGEQLPPGTPRILCLDIGGGTTDISAIEYNRNSVILEDGEFRAQKTINLLYRKGLNDFAGMDIDRRIVTEIYLKTFEEKVVAAFGAKGAKLERQLLEDALRGDGPAVLEQNVRPRAEAGEAAEIVQGIISTSMELLRDAEKAKIAAAGTQDPKGKFASTFDGGISTVIDVGGTLKLSDSNFSFKWQISLGEVNDLIRKMVTERLPVLDEVVKKARWTWSSVDVLMFTGQTCRAPALQDAVLDFVRQARGGSLPMVVIPPSKTEAEAASVKARFKPAKGASQADVEVIEFDPKICVASGAALRGYVSSDSHSHQIQLRVRTQAKISVFAGGDRKTIVKKGDPLPAFTPAVVHDHADGFVQLYVGDAKPKAHMLPSEAGKPKMLTLIVDDAETYWLVRTDVKDAVPTADVPAHLQAALRELPLDLHGAYQITGPVVTWCQRITPTVGGAS
jgi:molecular chaperone DnaK (HSP70)